MRLPTSYLCRPKSVAGKVSVVVSNQTTGESGVLVQTAAHYTVFSRVSIGAFNCM
jgi:hypothetical protein